MSTEATTAGTPRRPDLFTKGAPLGLHLRVERLQGVAETRNYYVVSDSEPRWYTRICWVCGNKHSPPSAQSCVYCASPLAERRFLMSTRWSATSKAGFQDLVNLRFTHPLLVSPMVIYRYREQMLAFYDVGDDALLADEPGPLRPTTVLLLAYRVAEMLDALHKRGVMLARLGAEHVLISRDGGVRLFDLDVVRVSNEPLPESADPSDQQGLDLADLGAMLLPWTAVEDEEVRAFLESVAKGAFTSVGPFRRMVYRMAQTTPRRPLPSRAASHSSVGMVRLINEDDYGWRQLADGSEVFVVCDGMGGHAIGDVASQLATETVLNFLGERVRGTVDPKAAQAQLSAALEAANSAVVKRGAKRGDHVGTTAVALWLLPSGKAVVAHAGDSRLYRLRAGQLTAHTEDNSMVAAMVAAGKISKDEARHHPKSNVLLAWLGNEEPLEPDVTLLDVQPGDRYVLCSDGLWGEVDDLAIADMIQQPHEPRRCARWLVQAALEGGGKDNITVIVLDAQPAS